jgi:hypothetical protein
VKFQKRNCQRNHPPGQKVYQRGAHTIWEVDGAKDKVCDRLQDDCPDFDLNFYRSCIVRIFHSLVNYLSMSRRFSLIAITVTGLELSTAD